MPGCGTLAGPAHAAGNIATRIARRFIESPKKLTKIVVADDPMVQAPRQGAGPIYLVY